MDLEKTTDDYPSMYDNDLKDEADIGVPVDIPGSSSGFNPLQCFYLNCNWGEAGDTTKTGACWDCFRCEPCCGDPCNIKDGCYCFCCYYWCSCCVISKLFAFSLDQDFHCINHCGILCGILLISIILTGGAGAVAYWVPYIIALPSVLIFIAFIAFFALIRRNIRVKYNIGYSSSFIGDFFMLCCSCTSICSTCQQFRAVPISGWDWLADIKERGINCFDRATICKIVRHSE